MATYDRSERELVRAFTGLVVESLAVTQDLGTATVRCRRCASDGGDRGAVTASTDVTAGRPGAGDPVVVVLNCYEGHSWEIQAVYCEAHGAAIGTVEDATDVRAEDQAVVAAVLEPAGYHAPDGQYHPSALTLGQVDVVDYSPTADGY